MRGYSRRVTSADSSTSPGSCGDRWERSKSTIAVDYCPVVDFLVHIDVRLPPTTDDDKKARLVEAEAARAQELAKKGTIVRLWRIPGRWSNVGIWSARDATELHDALSSLPLFPWLDVSVTPLADHPSDPAKDP